MRYGPSRFSCITSLAGLLLLFPAAAAECPAYRADVAPVQLDRLLDMAGAPYGSPNDDPNINNAGMNEEEVASNTRLRLWLRERSAVSMPEVRFGAENEPTRLELPDAVLVTSIDRWPCLLAPGDQAYLSDGVTDHSAMVYSIDRTGQTVTFIDARAREVFLLSANALFDDYGGVAFERDGRSFFAVPFTTLDKTLKQLVLASNYDLEQSRSALAAVLPELSPLAFTYWRDQDVFATIDYDRFEPPLDILTPRTSELLQQLVVNYLFLQGDLSQHRQGQVLPDDFATLALELPDYVSANMSFRLALDLIDAGEPEIAAALASNYQQHRGPDVDFALIELMAARLLGDEASVSALTATIRAELDTRLSRMYRGTTSEQNRALLQNRIYENTTIFLMRQRYEVLESPP